MHRCRKWWFWTKIRSTGVATVTFFMLLGEKTPKSDAQVSQTVILDQNPMHRCRKRWFWRVFVTLLDQHPMHRGRKLWFWTQIQTLIRSTGVANGDFFINISHLEQKSDAQMSQTPMLDQTPMHRCHKRCFWHVLLPSWTNIWCTRVANAHFGPKSDAQASQTRP